MKRLTLMFTIAIVAATLQTANAQVSLNINIGAQPRYGYYTDYYARPVVHRTYYAPIPTRYVYVERNNYRPSKHYRTVRTKHYYSTPSRHYVGKKIHYKHHNKSFKRHKGNGRGRH
ncbi:MAG: hypothetical protein EOO07_11845 [Chitinophagaceae bacterium]|nr:MAG: hypothetical protein EOO07_11845 [Chitinophagaceae bacterium]